MIDTDEQHKQYEAFNESEKEQSEPWEMPEFDSEPGKGRRNQVGEDVVAPPTAEEIAQIRQSAFDDGRQEGYEEGIKNAQQELLTMQQQFNFLMGQLAEPFEREEEQLTEDLAKLASSVTRHIIRRELQQDPEQIIAVIREAIKLLPSYRRQVMIHLHPDDANLVRKIFSVNEKQDSSWILADDPSITRGGCFVSTDTSKVDATVEKRIADLFSHVFGDQREQDNSSENSLIKDTATKSTATKSSTLKNSSTNDPSGESDDGGH
ncbi:MAG: flagellar assembly protein FliH [Gammaproteobacteria bacterium]|nr:flagellar assembly protein FliH [Gammaproteobacteria bacterium]